MTIDDVIAIVEDETGQKVTAETLIQDLEVDSLEFLNLLVALDVPNDNLESLKIVRDLAV